MEIIFNTRNDIQAAVSDQPIEYGKHGNPTIVEVVSAIQSHPSFHYGSDCSVVWNAVIDSVLN